jgi:hypothetical protein
MRNRGVSVLRDLNLGKPFFLSPFRARRECPLGQVLIGVFEIAQRLLQRLRIDLAQPYGCGLLFEPGQFGTKRAELQRFAGLSEMFPLAVQGPIPDESPRTSKPPEQGFLLGSRVKAIAIGCLNRSAHGSIIPDQVF